MSLAVWADSPDVPNTVCINARLRGAKTHPADLDGQTHGQAGWDIGMHFINLSDLARKLLRLISQTPSHMCSSPYSAWSWTGRESYCHPFGLVTRLAINAHGVPGTLYTGGVPRSDLARDPGKEGLALSVTNIPNLVGDLKRIHFATAPRATILLMGCIAGRGESGTALLKALAPLWPQRTIVAFETIGYQSPLDMGRAAGKCSEPGMRDSLSLYSRAAGSAQPSLGKNWNDLNAMPWASERSPGAKVLENGAITKALTE